MFSKFNVNPMMSDDNMSCVNVSNSSNNFCCMSSSVSMVSDNTSVVCDSFVSMNMLVTNSISSPVVVVVDVSVSVSNMSS